MTPPPPAAVPPETRERLISLLIAGFSALLVGACGLFAFHSLSVAREAALREAEIGAQNLAQVAAERTARNLQAVDLVLAGIGDLWTQQPGLRDPRNPQLQALLRAKAASMPWVRGLFILDASGTRVHDSGPAADPGADLSDSEYFHWHRNRTGGLYVGRPGANPEAGGWRLAASRRLSSADGGFTGVIVAALDARALKALFADLDAGRDGAIELMHGSGELIARLPEAPRWLGMATGTGITLKDLQAGAPGRTLRASSAIDGISRIYNLRPVPDAPLMVQAGIGEEEALAAWREKRTSATAALTVLVVATALLAWLLRRELQRHGRGSPEATLADTLREAEARYHSLFRNSIDAILVLRPDGSILAANGEACRMLEYGEADLRKLTRENIFDGGDGGVQSMMDELARSGSARGEFRMVRRDGSRVPVELSAATFTDRAGQLCASMIVRDITERRRAEEHIEYLAYHDELTGIPNRAHFQREFDRTVAMSQRYGLSCALLLVDLDRFKYINDTIGHQAGDQLLKQMAARLRACLRDSDVIARLGGDEFVILMQDAANMEAVTAVADKILEVASRPLIIDDQEFLVTASIGISVYPHDGADLQTLLRNSDLAMYRAKEAGKNGYQYFAPEMNVHSRTRMEIESALRGAIDRQEFVLHLQPKLQLSTLAVAGMEALVRWKHPERGLLNPGEFIGIAEETGLIVPIGDWVLEEACRHGQALREAGHRDLSVAVNLSARQLFDDELARRIADILRATGFPPQNLQLEITESAVMRDAEQAVRLLTALHATGVRMAIDDFGTGYSSLAYLKRFPIDCVKIDRSFVRDLPQNSDDVAITRSIIAMAHNMSLEIVAEGVETVQQLEFLRSCGCDEIQGFLFSEPLPAEAFARFLKHPTGRLEAGAPQA
ncbi:MAG TPA: EAL domain-containing protein [Burkholderiales bacterium]|nr:EAL domain-containing protein [Burkholderiales bacterium]